MALPETQTAPVRVMVGMGTCGLAAGAREVWAALEEELSGACVQLSQTGCIGMCEQEPLVDVVVPGEPRVTYGGMTPERVRRVVEEHVHGGRPVEEWVVGRIADAVAPYRELEFYRSQHRIVLRNCGFIDPDSLEEYENRDGYQGLRSALATDPTAVIETVKQSGLRGRGGAGFPTGLKWQFARQAPGEPKYLICNADEGDPGAFMDRSVLEGDPHAVLEGMVIAAHAVGASHGYIYVRAEYPLAVERIRRAIAQAREAGYLGRGILGSGRSFDLTVKEGAGAFVCGEETALISSIEGRRGMPRVRPPFPAQQGLWGKPTIINNVESYANIPHILREGAESIARLGTEKSKGTKVFALAGKVRHTGLVEVPMGVTIREIVEEMGGGSAEEGHRLKAVQIGGPSGGCIPTALWDTPVDYESLIGAGAVMGSGGLIVLDDTTCMVEMARFFMAFVQKESCGKCVPCREGTRRLLEILERIVVGEAEPEDLERLRGLSETVRGASLCALGQTAPNPLLSTLRYFPEEYLEHVHDKRCRAGTCLALGHFRVIAEKCPGCNKCVKVCPVEAINGKVKHPFVIDPDKCTKCGACEDVCSFDAIVH